MSFIEGPNLNLPDNTIDALFFHAAKRYPNLIALEFGDEEISYKELSDRVSDFASYLWEKGLRPGARVTISLERSPDFIMSVLAVLACGGVYVPIDLNYPNNRKELIIKDSQSAFFIGKRRSLSLDHDVNEININEFKNENCIEKHPLTFRADQKSIAYIIYTSGSTGKPKGVQVTHRNVVNLVNSMALEPGISTIDRISAVTSISFDAIIMETFLPLLHGATVVLVPEDIRIDGEALLKYVRQKKITVMWGTPTIWQILLDSGWDSPLTLKALIGGEPVPKPLADKLLQKCDELWNIYGPTETTVCALLTRISAADNPIVVGSPIANTYIHLLGDGGNPVNEGDVGEIVIGGEGVSEGYLNREDLTNKSFVVDVLNGNNDSKVYFSGDLGVLRSDGRIQCLGRKDNQVKIRGHRIELGEIETHLQNYEDIARAFVVVDDKNGPQRLVAYIQTGSGSMDVAQIRTYLEKELPEYMVPNHFVLLEHFPVTENGKIDKQKLPDPKRERPENAPLYKRPKSKIEQRIARIWADVLGMPKIGVNDNFFEFGATSLLTQKTATALKNTWGYPVPVNKIYQFPTVAQLSNYLEGAQEIKPDDKPVSNGFNVTKDVAIVGMSGRFPGAKNIDELWKVLKNGEETISFFEKHELETSIPKAHSEDPRYVAARGIIPSAKTFDAHFFGLTPKMAAVMDPQQRIFLEIAWEVLETTGHLPSKFDGSIGVYAGVGTNTYYKKNILPNEDLLNQIGYLNAETINEKDYIASRTAYHLNLKGPAVSIHSACSTSLLAIAQAVEAIRNGQCNVALAGGASITAPMNSGHLYQEGSMLSSDGHCRSFDAKGTGTVFSDGAGVVLLKSLEDAQRDGDTVHAVIKGIGVTNDGGNKGSFTAPSAEGQADAISRALNDANIDPASISYIEAHGTATPIGDPIEFEGLQMAFGQQKQKQFCALGSIKSNMGHLTAAAGVAGLIKTVLSLKKQQIPSSLGFKNANPAIDFEKSPFFVNDKLTEWKSEGIRRAGVSSFGVGGTNVHAILEEYANRPKNSDAGRPFQLLNWSGKSEKSLNDYQDKIQEHCSIHQDGNLADVAYSLQVTRENYNHRRIVVTNEKSVIEDFKGSKTHKVESISDEVVFLFPGQGAQFLQMGEILYEKEDVFKEAVDACAHYLLEEFGYDIRQIIYPGNKKNINVETLNNTKFAQPALFTIEYALSQLWLSWGILPTVVCGHSIGEFLAAHLAGVLKFEDALKLVALRGQWVSELERGSMLSVRLSAEEVLEHLPKGLEVAASNSGKLCVVSGPTPTIEFFSEELNKKGVACSVLPTSHAFHSEMMSPLVPKLREEVSRLKLHAPKIPMVSTVTGMYITEEEATDPNYWAEHLRKTVNFYDAAQELQKLENPVMLEMGPGRALTTLVKQIGKGSNQIAPVLLPNSQGDEVYKDLLLALGNLWLHGVEPDWRALYRGQQRKKVELPTYAFDRQPCWVDPIINQKEVLPPSSSLSQNQTPSTLLNNHQPMRKNILFNELSEIIANTSGIELNASEQELSFLELGLDSLILTQVAMVCQKKFEVPLTFRQLNEDCSSPALLVEYLDAQLPKGAFETQQPQQLEVTVPVSSTQVLHMVNGNPALGTQNNETALGLIAQQLQLLGRQIDLMQNGSESYIKDTAVEATEPRSENSSVAPQLMDERTEEEKKEHAKPFGASPKIDRVTHQKRGDYQGFLDDLIDRYTVKTAKSKLYAQDNRKHMSDPRVVSGFKPETKELTYPIVVEKSKGSKLWDLDGNEYLDALNGFGSCFFGHQPDFITKELKKQIDAGYEVGPQHPLAGEVSQLLCELTGHDRAALCNTGSEAVLGAMRIARTVTGRSLIVAFSKSYHGINDEGIVRGSKKMKTFPAAAGIMPNAVENMLILEYGTEESLQIIKERAHELAAVLVEPVQSRRPEFQPVEFLKSIREVTRSFGSVLIFDEVITGFRSHLGGAQALLGIKADLATYGKVIGGGLSIGAILGNTEFMDALDGGFWQYGDNSYPEVGVTYFAGTFVRHPLALAACKASLTYLKQSGSGLQEGLNKLTKDFSGHLNQSFQENGLPVQINYFSSLWRLTFTEEIAYSELLFVLLREKGIHIWDGFPCFFTEAYTKADIDKLTKTILESVDELQKAHIIIANDKKTIPHNINGSVYVDDLNTPPISNARLGRDENGNPAWYVRNEENDEYMKIEI